MPESEDTQRFDRLLDAMVNKPPLEVKTKDEPSEDDLREEDSD
ncbi:MAG: hypothetical protein Q7J13_09335 [Brevundimonas sp.]|nr:hypothetical protein [Brevundimonas sp.]MDO9588124.1 hypothetical protein [Brevundimonas sp.]